MARDATGQLGTHYAFGHNHLDTRTRVRILDGMQTTELACPICEGHGSWETGHTDPQRRQTVICRACDESGSLTVEQAQAIDWDATEHLTGAEVRAAMAAVRAFVAAERREVA